MIESVQQNTYTAQQSVARDTSHTKGSRPANKHAAKNTQSFSQLLDSMRSTLGKNSLTGKDSFAGKMYDDMMYEELSRTMTKNAGLGLADQIYLQLNQQG